VDGFPVDVEAPGKGGLRYGVYILSLAFKQGLCHKEELKAHGGFFILYRLDKAGRYGKCFTG